MRKSPKSVATPGARHSGRKAYRVRFASVVGARDKVDVRGIDSFAYVLSIERRLTRLETRAELEAGARAARSGML